MEIGRVTHERGDPFSRREWSEMVESRAFNVFLARLDKMIEAERRRCEQGDALLEIHRAQGSVNALRLVRDLPAVIGRELTSRA